MKAIGTLIVAGAMCFAADAGAQKQELPGAEQVIERYVKATRVDQLVARHSSMRTRARIEVPAQKVTGVVTELRAKPNKVLSIRSLPGRPDSKAGFDGEHAWSVDASTGPRLFTGDDLAERRLAAAFQFSTRDTATYPTRRTLGVAEFDGQPCYRVQMITRSGRESIECFSVATGLLVAAQRTVASSMGPVESLTIYSDYKEFGGSLMATRMTQEALGIRTVLTLESVVFDDVKAEELVPPPEVRALIRPG